MPANEPALKIRASIYILTKDEGGTGKPLKHMGQEMIFSRTFDCMAATNYDNADQRIMPGENGELTLILRYFFTSNFKSQKINFYFL